MIIRLPTDTHNSEVDFFSYLRDGFVKLSLHLSE